MAYLVGLFNRFCSNHGPIYVNLVEYTLQYISEILELSLTFDRKINILDDIIGYTDFDFARLKTNQKSIKRYVFIFIRATISYLSKL